MTPPQQNSKRKVVKIKALAVINKNGLCTIATDFGKGNNPFAIYKIGQVFSKVILLEYKAKVVPCEIHYSLPKKPKRKKR